MLTPDEIDRFLTARGFTGRHEVQYAIRYDVPHIQQCVYVNKQAGNASSGLVIHPRFDSCRALLLNIPGVHSSDKFNHKSSMTRFPRKLNKGTEESAYGIPFGFDTEKALADFIRQYLTLPQGYKGDEIAEINEAEVQLENLSPTEKEAVVKSRLGQGRFRQSLVNYWSGCSVTGCTEISLLKASHIKPWRDSNNAERLDAHNGLLLTPNLDTAFDSGLISFADDGTITISSFLDHANQTILGISPSLRVRNITDKHKRYLAYHRDYIFQS